MTEVNYRENFINKEFNILNDRERLKNYISHARNRADYFEYLRRIYLEINLALMAALFTIFPFMFNYIEDIFFKNIIIIGLITYLTFTIFNIFCYSIVKTENPHISNKHKLNSKKREIELQKVKKKLENPDSDYQAKENEFNIKKKELETLKNELRNSKKNKNEIQKKKMSLKKTRKDYKKAKKDFNTLEIEFWSSLWFHKNNVPRIKYFKDIKVMDVFLYQFAKKFELKSNDQNDINVQKFLKDDIKQIFLLYCHQASYSKSAKNVKLITLLGLIIFLNFLIVGLIFLLVDFSILLSTIFIIGLIIIEIYYFVRLYIYK